MFSPLLWRFSSSFCLHFLFSLFFFFVHSVSFICIYWIIASTFIPLLPLLFASFISFQFTLSIILLIAYKTLVKCHFACRYHNIYLSCPPHYYHLGFSEYNLLFHVSPVSSKLEHITVSPVGLFFLLSQAPNSLITIKYLYAFLLCYLKVCNELFYFIVVIRWCCMRLEGFKFAYFYEDW